MDGDHTTDTKRQGRGATALVLLGGRTPVIEPSALVDIADFVVAADSGLDHAETLGITPDLVVGDLDSVSAAALTRAQAAGVAVDEHPRDKDATDFDIALDTVRDGGFDRCVIVGGRGGRLSHLLGNATLLASPRYRTLTLEWWLGSTIVRVVDHDRSATIEGAPGDLVSLIPLGDATGVTTSGLKWPLRDERLELGTSRGVSNELVGSTAEVRVTTGSLLLITEKEDS